MYIYCLHEWIISVKIQNYNKYIYANVKIENNHRNKLFRKSSIQAKLNLKHVINLERLLYYPSPLEVVLKILYLIIKHKYCLLDFRYEHFPFLEICYRYGQPIVLLIIDIHICMYFSFNFFFNYKDILETFFLLTYQH